MARGRAGTYTHAGMGAIGDYFRRRRWQRRVVTSAASLTIGLVAAVAAFPHVADYLLVRALGSENLIARQKAMLRAEKAAKDSPRTLRRLNKALETGNDVLFSAVASALNNAGKLKTPQRDPAVIDRWRAIELATSTEPVTRSIFLGELILCGQDNRYVRKALATAMADGEDEIRGRAAVLAARLGDDASLEKLLADPQAQVAAEAALCAALAGRTALAPAIAGLLDSSEDPALISSAAYALALLDPKRHSGRICSLLKAAKEEPLRDRLLHVMTFLDDEQARAAVLDVMRSARDAEGHPPAMALLAAGKLRLAQAAPQVKATLAAATRPTGPPRESQVLAALEAARLLACPVRAEVDDICRKLWGTDWPLMLMAAARELGRQARLPQGEGSNAPSTQHCVETLRLAAVFSAAPESRPAGSPQLVLVTPMPSAAAAVALWELEASSPPRETSQAALEVTGQFVRNVAADPATLPGEYVAWHVGAAGPDAAFKLGQEMLPPLDAPPEKRVYNDNERSAGAMLMALSARTDAQRQEAVRTITSRLQGVRMGGEDSFFVIGAYRCALLILGREDVHDDVRGLLEIEDFPQRRVLAALCVTGDRQALDWVLWNPQIPPEGIEFLLVNKGIAEVFARTVPQLPHLDAAASGDLRLWQIRIMRDYYAIHRSTVQVGWKR